MTEPNAPFDLDARIKQLFDRLITTVDMPGMPDKVAFPIYGKENKDEAKKLIRDVLQAVKPQTPISKEPESAWLLGYNAGFNYCNNQLEANITNLLGDK